MPQNNSMSRKGTAAASLQKDAPWRAAPSAKPIPKIHQSPSLRLPQTPTSSYALHVMKVSALSLSLSLCDTRHVVILVCLHVYNCMGSYTICQDSNWFPCFWVLGAASESDRKWDGNGSNSGSGRARMHCPRTNYTHQITRCQGSSFLSSLLSERVIFYFILFNVWNCKFEELLVDLSLSYLSCGDFDGHLCDITVVVLQCYKWMENLLVMSSVDNSSIVLSY